MNDTSRRIESQEIQAIENSDLPFESSIVPGSFCLGGLKIDVVHDKNLLKNRRLLGEAQYMTQRIILNTSALQRQSIEQNFFHELVHWVLYMMNEDELRNNEKFVDLFAHFLYQARMTETREPNITPTESHADGS